MCRLPLRPPTRLAPIYCKHAINYIALYGGSVMAERIRVIQYAIGCRVVDDL